MRRLITKLALLLVVAAAVVLYVQATRDPGTDTVPDAEAYGRTRVLLIGVDGVDWERLERLVSEGRMPNLGGMMENGASGLLRSIPPFVSPSVWTTVATGKLEEKHGIGGFTALGQRGELTNSGMIKCKTIWEILAAAERTSGVIGWLVTYPPVPVTTYTVSSRAVLALPTEPDAPRPETFEAGMSLGVHPSELWELVRELAVVPSSIPAEDIQRHLGSLEHLDERNVESRMSDIANRLASDRTIVALSKRLISDYPTDLTAVYLRGSDIISHFFWRYWEPDSWTKGKLKPEVLETLAPVIDRYYESVDEMIGQLLELRDDDTIVIVCSDHGFAGHRGHEYLGPRDEDDPVFGVAMHREKGIIVVEGPGVERGVRVEGATVLDVTPTVLTALGLPVARDMDGRPLSSVFERTFLDRNPVAYIDTYETGEKVTSDGPVESPVDDEVRELLKSLGYIN